MYPLMTSLEPLLNTFVLGMFYTPATQTQAGQ